MYDVRVVADEDLPAEHDWALVEVAGRKLRFCVKASAVNPVSFAEGWAAARLMRGQRDNSEPRRHLRAV